MKSSEYYRGREQTYLKHFILERYLERVAYNVGSFAEEFVYVDGFSGPWRSGDQSLEDTSFMIAIDVLRRVREGLAKAGRKPRIRCLFIEKDPTAFRALETAVSAASDVGAQALRGEFEAVIDEVLRFVGTGFSLVFIDPTGWTGFGLRQIAPILRHRPGEILVNFMFDHINRFLDAPQADVSASFTDLFGGDGWEALVGLAERREAAIVELYRQRLALAGDFPYATWTRILKPTADRAYFYLVYGTRHPKGLTEFRGVEKRAVAEQERVRLVAKQEKRVDRTHQTELFDARSVAIGPPSFDEERRTNRAAARRRLEALINARTDVSYEDALAEALQLPLVWESDLKDLILELRTAGLLEVVGMQPRERAPKAGHRLVKSKPPED